MKPMLALTVLLLSSCATTTPRAPVKLVVGKGLSDAECEVWARELSFADSVARHDAAAFADHVHPEAIFGTSTAAPRRGRDEITKRWAPIVEGKVVRLHWYPTMVVLGNEPNLAFSSGPGLFEDVEAGETYISFFKSVWLRGADGAWRVLFDDGTDPSRASAEDIAAFKAGRRECPR